MAGGIEIRSGGEHPEPLTPQGRTERLFALEVGELAEALTRVDIAVYGTPRRLRVTQVEPFSRSKLGPYKPVGNRWGAMRRMNAGSVWNPQFFTLTQSLVVAQDHEGVGACVRLLEATYYDPETKIYIPEEIDARLSDKENGIALHLGLEPNEVSELRFIDDTDILYLFRKREEQSEDDSQEIDHEQVRREMDGLFER